MPRKTPEPEAEEAKRIREDTEAVAGIISKAMAWERQARYLSQELARAQEGIARLEETVRDYELRFGIIKRALHATPPTR